MKAVIFEHTFETYVVDESNKFAHAAAVTIAEHPQTHYNPLYLYGDCGTGKTHLVHAIEKKVLEKEPDMKAIYIKCEDFTNEMISALCDKSMKQFRERFRNCDLLIVEDLQYCIGKITTQEELFHTLESLIAAKTQIILTADCSPECLQEFDKHLKARLQNGLVVDIGEQSPELLLQIAKSKAEQAGVSISTEIMESLRNGEYSSAFQIEGAIKRQLAQKNLL